MRVFSIAPVCLTVNNTLNNRSPADFKASMDNISAVAVAPVTSPVSRLISFTVSQHAVVIICARGARSHPSVVSSSIVSSSATSSSMSSSKPPLSNLTSSAVAPRASGWLINPKANSVARVMSAIMRLSAACECKREQSKESSVGARNEQNSRMKNRTQNTIARSWPG